MNDKTDVYDCIIVGGGVAGLSGALFLGRARRRVLVCDKGNPRNAPAHESHTFLTRDGTPPLELLRIAREQLGPYSTVEFQEVGVREIRQAGAQFEAVFEDGTTRTARKILFAFGVKDEFLPIENFADFWGESVFHCPFCHGYEVRDQPLAVIASGNVAMEKVALLRMWSANLVLCTDGDSTLSPEQRSLLQKHNVPVHEERIARFEGTGRQLERIIFASGQSIVRRGALVYLGQHLRSDLAEKLGCELNDFGLLKVDALGTTTVPGVYAAGDITSPMQSLATAVAQAATAAGGGITRALMEEDFV
jgi:thioredoxin reductase